MFIKIFLNYLFGYLNITVEGFFIERFINSCTSKGIFLWNLNKKNSSLLNANISISGFRRIKEIAKKTKCRIKVNYKRGVPFLLNKYRKRKTLIILLIPIILIIILSSMYVWNIEVTGLENIDEQEFIIQLKENGLEVGKLKNQINTKNIITNIRLQRTDISWMEISLKGTNAVVNVVEAEAKPDIIEDEEYCDIVSNKKGIITKITAEKGTALVKVGDMVESGTTLIAGYMKGNFTDTRFVHAQGEVQAKVWYTKRKSSTFTREITKETGEHKNKYSINLNKFRINLYKSIPNFQNYDTIVENKRLKLFSNFYLPIIIQKTTYKEQINEKVTYGKAELQNLLILELEEEFEKENIDKSKITNKVVNVYQISEDTIEVELTYEVLEKIGTEEKINF